MRLTQAVIRTLLEDLEGHLKNECKTKNCTFPETVEQLYGFGTYDPELPSLRHGLERLANQMNRKFSPKYLYTLSLDAQKGGVQITKSLYRTIFFQYLGYDSLIQYLLSGRFSEDEILEQRQQMTDKEEVLKSSPEHLKRLKDLKGTYRLIFPNPIADGSIVQAKIIFNDTGTATIYQHDQRDIVTSVESDAMQSYFMAEVTPWFQKNFYHVFISNKVTTSMKIYQGVVATTNSNNKPVALRVYMILEDEDVDFTPQKLTVDDEEYWAINKRYKGLLSRINMWDDLLVCSQITNIYDIVDDKRSMMDPTDRVYMDLAEAKIELVEKAFGSINNVHAYIQEAFKYMDFAIKRGFHNFVRIEGLLNRCKDLINRVDDLVGVLDYDIRSIEAQVSTIKLGSSVPLTRF